MARILATSRSSGTNTNAGMPAFAAWAAVALARLPVEAHETASNPKALAMVMATETTRSLNEFEGLTESSLIHRRSMPRRSPSRSASRSGVNPAPRSTRSMPGPPGNRASYRHSDAGPASTCLRKSTPSTASRSYAGSRGPKHSSQIVRASTGYRAWHSRHSSATGLVISGSLTR